MPVLLAIDYGKYWGFLLVFPAIGISLLLGAIFRVAGDTTAHRVCGLMAILFSGIFLFTIGDVREDAQLANVVLSVVGGSLGFLLMRTGARKS